MQKSVTQLPKDKLQLVSLYKQGKARIYHTKVCKANQGSSNLEKWLSILPLKNEALIRVAYQIKHIQFGYEPIFVAKADNPNFDERFIGYGFTRNTQVLQPLTYFTSMKCFFSCINWFQIYQMHLARYRFFLLNNVFLCHWGFQTTETTSASRKAQVKNNQAKMKNILAEYKVRYQWKSKNN